MKIDFASIPDEKKRHSTDHPCPVCGGYDQLPHGEKRRCHGYTFGPTAYCSREEKAGGLQESKESNLYAHALHGVCGCGKHHDVQQQRGKDSPAPTPNIPKRLIATYDYRNATGDLLYQVCRLEPKSFTQRRPDGHGGWVYNLKGVDPVLYRLPAVLQADPAQVVFIPEGEKDADRLAAIGLVSTCNSGGAGKWRPRFNDALRGRHVVVIADNDGIGHKHAERIASFLFGIAASVKVLRFDGVPAKGDVSDWLDAGNTVDDLTALVANTRPFDPPSVAPDAQSNAPTFVQLADVEPTDVYWLWQKRVPLGKITMLDGDPGLGKSTLTADLAARVTTGAAMPDGTTGDIDGPACVLLLSAEDGPEDTIRPRLDAAGADIKRVAMLQELSDGRLPEIPGDLAVINAYAEENDVKLIVIDPLMAYLPSTVNAHRDQDVRRALAPLARLAQDTGAAIVVVRHLNKMSGSNAVYRGGGSIGIIGAARSGLLVAKHPDDETRRVLAMTKSNLAAPAPSLIYRLVAADESSVAHVEWDTEDSGLTATQLLTPSTIEAKRGATDSAVEFLEEILKDGPVPVKQIKAEAKEAGLSSDTVDRAKARLGIKPKRDGFGDGGKWVWALPVKFTPKIKMV